MKKISIIIPAYNEEKTIFEIIEKVKNVNILNLEKEIIVVDNNSTDNTFKIASNIPEIKLFRETKRGKGAAVKKGFKEATGDILTIQDADLEYNPDNFQDIIKPIIDKKTEVVNGVRKQNKNTKKDIAFFLHQLGNNIITLTTNILYFNNAKEYEGCYKAFTKKIIDSIEIKTNDFDFDNELMCKILKRGIKPIDIFIDYNPRSYKDGKKINWKHGFKILLTIIKTRF